MRKNSYARHLLRQPPLECESTPSEGFLAAAAPICFSLIKRVFRDALNTDFGLNIDIEKTPTKTDISEYQKRVNEQKAYREYEKNAWQILCDYLWLMREWKKRIPASPDDELDKRFVYALHHFDYAEYLCDEFFQSDKNGRAEMKNCVSEIADFLSRLG